MPAASPFRPAHCRLGFLAVLTLGHAPAIFAQTPEDSRFAVADLSVPADNERVVLSVESDIARLRPGAKPIDDLAMKRLLMTGEGPSSAAARLLKEAEERKTAGECAAAVERAGQAEIIILSSVPMDEERDMLRSAYTLMVLCEDQRGRNVERATAALRLRSLVALAPADMPAEVWDKHVAGATFGAATIEIQIDSDPPNAQISVDFHGVGVTPRTFHIAPGSHYIEVQKEGYRKAFRQLTVGSTPARTVFRLVERTHDRLDQARAALSVLRKSDAAAKPQALARLAQFARVDTLVVLTVDSGRVRINFFDAERGAVSGETIDSAFDPATGRVTALADRPTPGTTSRRTPAQLAPKNSGQVSTTISASPTTGDALPEARSQQVGPQYRRRVKPPTPWWSWALAGVVGASMLSYIYFDQPHQKDTLALHAHWSPPAR